MLGADSKAVLQRYLQEARDALLWKLDDLGEYEVRRPLTPTGTNLLGLVKHLAYVEAGYFGTAFARPFPEPLPDWDDAEDADPNADLWARPEESRADVVGLYRRVWAHADATIAAHDLDAVGTVPWWGDEPATLHLLLVHVATETHRHAGHADIVRELIDGAAGLRATGTNLPDGDATWWATHHERVEQAARQASEGSNTNAAG